MGYHLAGHTVIGVDIDPQPRYPFEFIRADAMTFPLEGFDFVHASPPCQRFSQLTHVHGHHHREKHPDLIAGIRKRLEETGVPYAIENVIGSPLRTPVKLCGSMFAETFQLRRHRLFETSFPVAQRKCQHKAQPFTVGVYGHTGQGANRRRDAFVSRTPVKDWRDPVPAERGMANSLSDWKVAMGIDWMTAKELSQAIPPTYTKYIIEQYEAQGEAC